MGVPYLLSNYINVQLVPYQDLDFVSMHKWKIGFKGVDEWNISLHFVETWEVAVAMWNKMWETHAASTEKWNQMGYSWTLVDVVFTATGVLVCSEKWIENVV